VDMLEDPADEHEYAEYAAFKEMRLKRASPKPGGRDAYEKLKNLFVERLSSYLEQEQGALAGEPVRPYLLEHFHALLVEDRIVLTGTERRQLFEDVLGELSSTDPQVDSDRSG
jgi:hypothetical protein